MQGSSKHRGKFRDASVLGAEKYGRENARTLRELRGIRFRYPKRKPGVPRGKRSYSPKAPRVFQQRVVIKARYARSRGGKGIRNLRAHLSYLSRSGTGMDGIQPDFLTESNVLSRKEVSHEVLSWEKDEYHWRFIISPEKGSELDLPSYLRAVMERLEKDLKTKLNWFGVCHYNTENPHCHVLVRGTDELGKPLVLDRSYIQHGFREMAEEEATLRLGPRLQADISESIQKGLRELRPISIDRKLLAEQQERGWIELPSVSAQSRPWEIERRAQMETRLEFLQNEGYALREVNGRWRVSESVLESLQLRGRKAGLVKMVEAALPETVKDHEVFVYDRQEAPGEIISGEVVAKILIDELYDRKAIVIRGARGRLHAFALSPFAEMPGFEVRVGAQVSIGEEKYQHRAEDVIARFAGNNQGIFSLEKYAKAAKESFEKRNLDISFEDYLDKFKQRAESLTRLGFLSDVAVGTWTVPSDLIEKLKERDEKLGRDKNVRVTPLSYFTIEEQITAKGRTYLDQIIEKEVKPPSEHMVLRSDLREAITRRRAFVTGLGIRIVSGYGRQLQAMELEAARSRLGDRYGKPVEALERGRIVAYESLSDGYYKVIANSEKFMIVPVEKFEQRHALGTELEVEKRQNRDKSISYRTKPVEPSRENSLEQGRKQ